MSDQTPTPKHVIIGHIKQNNGIKGPGFAEWDEPVYGSPDQPVLNEVAQLRADLAKVRDENATLTAELKQAREALKQWHSSFFWRQSPDDKGFHMVEDKVIQRCLILTCAALAQLTATEK